MFELAYDMVFYTTTLLLAIILIMGIGASLRSVSNNKGRDFKDQFEVSDY